MTYRQHSFVSTSTPTFTADQILGGTWIDDLLAIGLGQRARLCLTEDDALALHRMLEDCLNRRGLLEEL